MFNEFLRNWWRNFRDFLLVTGLFIALLVVFGIGAMLIGLAGKFFGLFGVIIVGILYAGVVLSGIGPYMDYLGHSYFEK
jgi:hypothetical protein